MMFKAHPIVIYIDRSGFSLYQDTLPNIARFHFTPDLIRHSDVLSKDQVVSLISTFITLNKIVGSSLVVILSDDIIYVKDLPVPQKPNPSVQVASQKQQEVVDDKTQQDEVQKFLEIVPFEDVLAKVIKTTNLNRIVAVNNDLVATIAGAFVDKGSNLEGVIPAFMYGQSFSNGLTQNSSKTVLENGENFKAGNLLTNQEKVSLAQTFMGDLKLSAVTVENKKPKNTRQYILIGVFGLLLVVLGIVSYFSLVPQSVPQKPAKTSSVKKLIKPSVSPTVSPVNYTNILISITASKNNQDAEDLRAALVDMGVINVEKNISTTPSPVKTSVTISQNIPSEISNAIVAEVKEVFPEISIIEGEASGSAIAIVVGKS
jgi:hypothetical protein